MAAHHETQGVRARGTSDRILTIPNALSAVRLALLPLFVWLVLGPEADAAAVGVLVAIGLSDYLDGYLARRLDQTSKLGALLDPVADRLYILAAVVALGVREIIPLWLVVGLPARDVFLWLLVPFLRTRGYSALPVHFLGKAATAALIYAFPLLLLGDGDSTVALVARVFGWAFAVWGIGMYWWAGVLYAWQVRRLLTTTPPLPRRPRGSRRTPARRGGGAP
ncbi:CDP-alcohol phosphatidyltransferase family protein [Nocardioides caldifontis]|uniref:CDP-alcohol phosphatidyltransferase family protein n=1 Tax=Nocardioides caldifontis TaxID=2588938 RepID=UPI001EF08D51|nr:CDP-alcohol phosphatidyltransferase family protein [Nocardioides caldifontis]